MKISNQKLMLTYRSIFMNILMMIIAITGADIFLTQHNGLWVVVLCCVVFFLAHFMVRLIFEYDSSGEVLVFKNRTIFSRNSREFIHEFPKFLLDDYKILESPVNRKLYIKVKSEKRISLLQFNISFIGRSNLNKLRLDLDGLLEQKNT